MPDLRSFVSGISVGSIDTERNMMQGRMSRKQRDTKGQLPFVLSAVMVFGALSFGQTPDQWVSAHNNYRRNLVGFDGNPTSSPDLIWSAALANDAQDWANRLAASAEGMLQHRPNSGNSASPDARSWGENLAWGTSATYTGLEGLTAWYNERPFFNPATSKCTAGNVCGHYTQVISQLSREVGCATAMRSTAPNAGLFVVCNYSPHGNTQQNGAYAELYRNQRPPVPGGAVFANLNTTMQLDLRFNQCLLDLATGLLAAPPPATAGTPTTLTPSCNFATVRSYDTGIGATGSFTPDSAGGQLINLYFNGQVLGVNGAVIVRLSPARAVLVTGE